MPKLTKKEKLLSIKRTISEVDEISIIFCSSNGPETPFNQTVEEQEYTISFASSGRGRLLDAEIVRKALTENLGVIRDAIRHHAKQKLYEAETEALDEAKSALEFIKSRIRKTRL